MSAARVLRDVSALATRGRRRAEDMAVPDAITESDVKQLCRMVEHYGVGEMSAAIGVSQLTLMRACAGMLHTCHPQTRARIVAFFGRGAR